MGFPILSGDGDIGSLLPKSVCSSQLFPVDYRNCALSSPHSDSATYYTLLSNIYQKEVLGATGNFGFNPSSSFNGTVEP